jgi:glycosidase
MLLSKNIIIIALAMLGFTSCKKNTNTDVVQFGTPFNGVPDTKDIAMYEVNVPDFSYAGNFAGVTARLDSIKALGINVIWLMPIYPRGTDPKSINSPYCVKNYEAVNPNMGTLDDLRTLVDSAHSKGMSVILDWVADHTSWDNAWIANKSWYQQDANGNIIPPVGSGYTDVAGLNYANTDLRLAMIKAMKYWILTANIDGYRCDYAGGPPEDFWAAAIDSLKAMTPNHKLILLAEDYHYTNFTAGFQMCYGWNFSFQGLLPVFATSNSSSAYLLDSINQVEDIATLPPGAFMLRFTSNHDEDLDNNTPLVLFNGKQGSMAAFVLAAYMGGVPLIYDGQEIGCATKLDIFNQTVIDWSTNPDMMQQYKLIMGFRKTSDAVRGGSIQYFSRNNDVSAFERISGSDSVAVIVNVRNAVVNYTFDPSIANTNWLDALNNKASVSLGTSISLQPYQYMILSNH